MDQLELFTEEGEPDGEYTVAFPKEFDDKPKIIRLYAIVDWIKILSDKYSEVLDEKDQA
jgi:hypothetical protein